MFSTIRYSNVADGPCYLEKTAAPFDRKRHSKPARIACWSCRVSKLRCSGESNGCQRCTGKKIKCRYPEVPGPAPRRLVNTEKCELSPPKTSPDTIEDTPGSKVGPCTAADAAAGNLTLAKPPLAAVSPTATTECDNSSPDSTPLSLDPGSGLSQSFEWPSFLFSNFQTCADENMDKDSDPCMMTEAFFDKPDDSCSLAVNNIPDEGFNLIGAGAKNTRPNCSCFERIIYTHEDIEVNLLWRRYNIGSGDDNLLQNQKRALADFESLMECGSCTARSAYMMLLISIGRRILDSLDAVDGTGPPAPAAMERDYYDDGAGGGGRCKRARKVSIGNWKLDADDEFRIFQSLAAARATKLSGLVEKLERITRSHNWPAHQDILGDMSEVLRKKCMAYAGRIEEISQTLS
ncbi:uncharacterized protein F4807DRAFT_208695 [Annulohypoxylon truncatum]|uniref:uncharacterized protein n=1 Tax=Annulohypoxylon truncatum TaxID=327061 RepID=UPI00200845EF|nr:uncharacterized protein F4807DRAFT_208695 [Annulohypoxylon truncatum]KAI1206939.1 hypothetical protein F4807DRAFT_208695 [Annulohypoxylon truncatum]